MENERAAAPWKHAAWPFVAPFAVLVVLLAIERALPDGLAYPLRTLAAAAALLLWSRPLLSFRASRPLASVAVGLAVFAIWVGPDLLWPGYRRHWLFENALAGYLGEPARLAGGPALWFRAAGPVLVVPFAEELFWRGWLMRWLISSRFEKVPLGTLSRGSFLVTAVLFGAEHGPYWDVGVLAGIAYGWWMVKTRNLADCILAHAVTNAALAVYVVWGGRWEYWL